MPPFVSIITPVKSESRYITECIASLLSLDYPKDSFEIIIVMDRNATSAVKKVLKSYRKKIKIIQSKKSGSAANRNLGVSRASRKAKYLAFTDADCVAERGWLRTLVQRIEQVQGDEKEIGVIGGLNLVPESDNKLAKTIGAMEQTLFGGGGSAQVSVMGEEQIVPSLPNCNAMYKAGLWKKEQQDERLIVGQDGEFNYRLSMRGVRFLAIPDAIVWHHRTSSFRGFMRRMFKYGEATSRIWKKHRSMDFLRIRWYGVLPVIALFVFIGILVWSFLSLTGLYTLAFVMGMYAAADILTTISVVQKTRMHYSMIALILLPLQHFMYAVGFMKGMIR